MAEPTAQRIWDAALGQLQIHVTRPNYDTWLKNTTGLRFDGGTFVVGVPTEFVKEWLSTRMGSLVSQTVGGILGQPLEVTYEIVGTNGHSASNGHAGASMPLSNGHAAQAVISRPHISVQLNPRNTFRNFVVADSNRIAAAAAACAAENPGQDYNPLFVYSTPGLGKTHLLQAIALTATQGGHNALYVTSEQFTNDFVTAIAQGRADEFRRRYRSVQLLLIDDIQFFAGKNRTQEEFFYTFNDLHSAGCQLVVACDRPPASLNGLEGRLCSRFQWGLIADIQPPDEETRLAILMSKSASLGVTLPEGVAHLLAARATDNVRELEGFLNRVIAFARLTNAQLSLGLAERALAALTPSPTPCDDPQAITNSVANYFNVSVQALTGKSRAKPIAEARHVAMFLLREDADLALKQIGLILGHRDHSTIIHGINKITRLLSTDPQLSAHISDIRSSLTR